MNSSRTQVLCIRTPEGVAFTLRLASPVLRATAFLIDLATISAAWSILAGIIGLLNVISHDLAGMIATVTYFVCSQGYTIATEWRWQGQTLGKRLLKLRVIDARGLHLSFSQVVLRNLLRFIDGLPLFYLVGGVTSLLNSRAQRLGDMAAGTLVVWEPAEPLPDFDVLAGGKYNSLRSHAPAVARLRQSVSPSEARAASLALARRDELEPEARVRLFADLAAHFAKIAAPPPDAVDGVSDEQFVRNVLDVLYVTR